MGSYEDILEKIKIAVINKQHVSIWDEIKIVCLFYELFMKNGAEFASGFQTSQIIESLPSDFSEDIKQMITNVIDIIRLIPQCSVSNTANSELED